MGTVGISFGSPTGGAGFNVSSTVSQIVANLQNVETPWQTQLSASEAQDTTISSLGTLLATLTTDIGNFNNLQGSVLSTMEGSSSDPSVVALTAASSTAIAGTHTIVVNWLATTSSGDFTEISNAKDTLSGSISLAVGSATAKQITLGPSNNTLAGMASAINNAGVGIDASVVTDANGSRLSLVSATSGAGGNIVVSANSITDTSTTPNTPISYTSSPVVGINSSLTVDGASAATASNTVSTVIPGVTFQMLAPSPVTGSTPESVQIDVLNDTATVVSSMGTLVSDYNAVISAVNTQETNNTSGAAEPLFGSPTLSMLQEQLLSAIGGTTPNGYLTQLAPPTGNLTEIASSSDTLSGSITLSAGSSTAKTITLDSSNNTLAGLANAINKANAGVTASIVTNASGSRLSLVPSGSGAVAVSANSITDTTVSPHVLLAYISPIPDTLSGTLSISVGTGAATQFSMASLPTANQNLAGLASAINTAAIGVAASVVTDSSGYSRLQLTSTGYGVNSSLTVDSSIIDSTTSTSLAYNANSDVNSLYSLGVTQNNDGTISLDTSTLNAELNSDFSGVVGFFQNAYSWGSAFSTTVDNLGTSNPIGSLNLALTANSAIESSLRKNISDENLSIATQQSTLTQELNSANEILQAIPSNLNNLNELYSAITGYNAPSGG